MSPSKSGSKPCLFLSFSSAIVLLHLVCDCCSNVDSHPLRRTPIIDSKASGREKQILHSASRMINAPLMRQWRLTTCSYVGANAVSTAFLPPFCVMQRLGYTVLRPGGIGQLPRVEVRNLALPHIASEVATHLCSRTSTSFHFYSASGDFALECSEYSALFREDEGLCCLS